MTGSPATPHLWDLCPDFWDEARAIFARVLDVCGAPRELADLLHLHRAEHRKRADLVLFLERLVRRILIVAASAIVRSLPPARPRPARPAAPATAQAGPKPRPAFDRHAPPEDWHVGFSFLTAARHRRTYPSRRARHRRQWLDHKARLEAAGVRRPFIPAYAPAPLVETAALARRAEALRRILDNPEPWVLRAAQRMRRLRARNRTANLPLRFRADAWPRIGGSLGWAYCSDALMRLETPTAQALDYLDSG